MDSIVLPHSISVARLRAPPAGRTSGRTSFALQLPCLLLSRPGCRVFSVLATSSDRVSALRRSSVVFASGTLTANSAAPSSGVYTVGDFMTTKEELHVVKPTTTVDEAFVPTALEILVEKRITGFPVIDDDWKLASFPYLCSLKLTTKQRTPSSKTSMNNSFFWLRILSLIIVGLVSDYDLLALDSISGSGRADNSMFPEVDSTWKVCPLLERFYLAKLHQQSPLFPEQTFNEVQKLLSKTNGKMVGDLMTPAPVVVRETTNLEDAARLLLETKYRRLPVVDADGKLVGIITRGNVVRAALQIKHATEMGAQ
ncbi:hypothetical protein WN943_021474 [Citrus x changshan-huyou]